MKEIGSLIPIWKANTPPTTLSNENDFLLKLSIEDNEIMFGSIYWCTVEKRYYFEPVVLQPDPDDSSRMLIAEDEAFFSSVGLQLLKQSLADLGITHTRRVFDINKPTPNYTQQLEAIHPSLVITVPKEK